MEFKEHVWFWAIIAVILALHVPFSFCGSMVARKRADTFLYVSIRTHRFSDHLGGFETRRTIFLQAFFFLVGMERIPIAGAVLLVVLGTGLLIRVKNLAESIRPKTASHCALWMGERKTRQDYPTLAQAPALKWRESRRKPKLEPDLEQIHQNQTKIPGLVVTPR
jgi:hypothetical protein